MLSYLQLRLLRHFECTACLAVAAFLRVLEPHVLAQLLECLLEALVHVLIQPLSIQWGLTTLIATFCIEYKALCLPHHWHIPTLCCLCMIGATG